MHKSLNIPRRLLIPGSVFLTGAAVLVIEVVAVRLLSPYFGNTIYTFSSVLSVVLAGLSVGYSYGGKLADRRPYAKNYLLLIILSGLAMLSLNFLAQQSLPSLSSSLSISIGPLVTSILFFFVPALLLGALSPYAVKLQSLYRKNAGVGEVAGQIFFWSTLGSIIGSLATGFVLIPNLGVNTIMVSTSMFLVLLGVVPLLIRRSLDATRMVFVGVLATVLAVYSFGSVSSAGLIFETNGVYGRIAVAQGVNDDGRLIRILLQDRSNSGAVYRDETSPIDLAYGYARYYGLALHLAESTDKALVIGAGMYSYPRALQYADSDIVTDVVDIEPGLQQIAEDYFNLNDTSRINSHVTDGRKFLNDTDKTYDIIFGDAFNAVHSIPAHLSTSEFYELVKAKLSPGGVYMMNIHGKIQQANDSITLSQYKTLSSVFSHVYVFAVEDPGSDKLQNLMFVGIDRPLDIGSLTSSSDESLAAVEKQIADFSKFDLSQQVLLTDDYAPVDHLSLKLLKE